MRYVTLSGAARSVDFEQENARLSAQNVALQGTIKELQQQLDWFKRQLFGQKSEKRLDVDYSIQPDLLAGLGVPDVAIPEPETQEVAYVRRKKRRDADSVNDTGLRFDDSVPVETIVLSAPGLEDIPEDQRIVIGEKITWRLAQRPGSTVILKYVRPVIKRRDDESIINTPAPAGVLDRCAADVSFLAGMTVDKFLYHLPLYRQHQRLKDAGIDVSRVVLTQWMQRTMALLGPIADAQYRHVLLSRVLAMDETPIKAGRKSKGKLNQAYYWPLYGDADEVVFLYAKDRSHGQVKRFLGDAFSGTLVSDGYEAYARYAKSHAQVTHAQCWAHTRRHFDNAKEADPQAAEQALSLIGALYRHEDTIRDKKLDGQGKLKYRTQHSEPVVQAFWHWCNEQCHRGDMIPSHPLTKALKYALERKSALQVFLTEPDVPIDTNHLERALRAIPMGRKSWLFCWTELGARHVGIIQSLLVTCRLHDVDPYAYLVDVLQRVGEHPASQVIELTPRVWKDKFAGCPLKSDLQSFGQ